MLLKCRYLSQFSLADVTKNAANISKAVESCPFMNHARRTLTTSTSNGSTNEAALNRQENQGVFNIRFIININSKLKFYFYLYVNENLKNQKLLMLHRQHLSTRMVKRINN